jgi:hypothetical protein
LFGPLGTLQNVATIISRQMTPVLGGVSGELCIAPIAPVGELFVAPITPVLVSGELFVAPLVPSCDVCAATGDAAMSKATVNASIFITGSIRWNDTDSADSPNNTERQAGDAPPRPGENACQFWTTVANVSGYRP